MLRSKINGEITLPDFPDDDNTVTTTVTKSRRVSFGTNFVKEFIVGSAVSAQCMSEYEQAFPSSDSSNADSSHSIVESAVLNHGTFASHETQKVLKAIPQPPQVPESADPGKTRAKAGKFSSTICFSSDSPTADMEFTEGCLTLAKSILDKKNKEMTVIIQAKSKEGEKENAKVEETKYFDGSEFEMSVTRCLKPKESSKREESRFDMDKTNIFGGNEDESDSSWEESWDGLPLNLMMNKDPEKVMKSLQASFDDGMFKIPRIPKAGEIFPDVDTNTSGESMGDMSLTFENGKIVGDLSKDLSAELKRTGNIFEEKKTAFEVMEMTNIIVKKPAEVLNDQMEMEMEVEWEACVEVAEKTKLLEKNESLRTKMNDVKAAKVPEKEQPIILGTKKKDGTEIGKPFEKNTKIANDYMEENERMDVDVMEKTKTLGNDRSDFAETNDCMELEVMETTLDKSPKKPTNISKDKEVLERTKILEKGQANLAETYDCMEMELMGTTFAKSPKKSSEVFQDKEAMEKTKILEKGQPNLAETNDCMEMKVIETTFDKSPKKTTEKSKDNVDMKVIEKTAISQENQSKMENDLLNEEDMKKTKTVGIDQSDFAGTNDCMEVELMETALDKSPKKPTEVSKDIMDANVIESTKSLGNDQTDLAKTNQCMMEVIETTFNKSPRKPMEVSKDNIDMKVMEKTISQQNQVDNDHMEEEVLEKSKPLINDQSDFEKANSCTDMEVMETILDKSPKKPTEISKVIEETAVSQQNQSKLNDPVNEEDIEKKTSENEQSNLPETNDCTEMEFTETTLNKTPRKPTEVSTDNMETKVIEKTKTLENDCTEMEITETTLDKRPKKPKEDGMDIKAIEETTISQKNKTGNDRVDEEVVEKTKSSGNDLEKTNDSTAMEITETTLDKIPREPTEISKVIEKTKTSGNDTEMEGTETTLDKSPKKPKKDTKAIEKTTISQKKQMEEEVIEKAKPLATDQSEHSMGMDIEADEPLEPTLVDIKVIENLIEQSKESNCVWSLEQVQHPQRRRPGFLSLNCSLLQSTMVIQFSLEASNKDDLDACSYVRSGSITLRDDEEPGTPEYSQVLEFGFDHSKKYFEARRSQVQTIRDVSYFLDQINAFAFKMNAFLRQIHTVLTCYPGSRLTQSSLSFRLFSFPIFFSCTLSIDLSNLHRLSPSSLSFRSEFGNCNQNEIREIFTDSIKSENCLCEFIVRSTRYLFDIEKKTGVVSKRRHIRLLPEELRL